MVDFVAEENKDVGNESSQVADTSSAVREAVMDVKKKPIKKNRISGKKVIPDSADVNIRIPDGTVVQNADKNKNSSSTDKTSTENQGPDAQKINKPQRKVPNPIPETKTNKYENDIKNAVMIYDTIDEAIKTKNVKDPYPYTKSFAQTNKTRKGIDWDRINDWTDEKINRMKHLADKKINEPFKKWMKDDKTSSNKESEEKRAARLDAKNKKQKEKEEIKESKDQAETDADNLVNQLLDIEINFDDIKADHRLIIELHIKIQDVEGGPKAYITKLENEAMNMKGGKRGKRTRRKRQPVQKGGNSDNIDIEKEKKKKKLKIVNILKQLNSANYIDYEIESIIQELKRLLGRPSTVDILIPETITTTTTIQEDMYSEPLPICTDKDKNSNETCKKNREKLENRLKYFNKLKELNAMHNDNELVIFAENTFKYNKENITAYYKPYAKSDDTTNNKADKDKKYLATLEGFKTIDEKDLDKKDSILKNKITKYNKIVKELNDDKKHIVNPQLNEKLMTTNTKQTVTQSSSLKNILDVEHVLNMIGSFNMDEYQSTYGNANNMGDPGHTKTSSSSVVKSTDILRNKEPENNVEAK